MSDLVLLRPGWLAALPLLAVLTLWQWRRGPAAGGWERVMPSVMLAAMRALGHLRSAAGRQRYAALAAAALIGLGLSGPALPRADTPLLAGSGAILIAIDMSPSVAESPALADAQAAAAAILAAANGRPVGLVLYSGEAYDVAAPPRTRRRWKARSRCSRPTPCPAAAVVRRLPWRWRGRCSAGAATQISC